MESLWDIQDDKGAPLGSLRIPDKVKYSNMDESEKRRAAKAFASRERYPALRADLHHDGGRHVGIYAGRPGTFWKRHHYQIMLNPGENGENVANVDYKWPHWEVSGSDSEDIAGDVVSDNLCYLRRWH